MKTKDDVTTESLRALSRKLEVMKATGMYDQWLKNMREEPATFEASPRGRLERFLRGIQGIWWRVTGRY